MKTLATAVIATAILGVASAAHADLTQSGAVGLPLNPTAQIPAEGGVRIQGNYYDQGDIGAVSTKSYGVVAAGRVGDNIEVNGGWTKFDTNPTTILDKSGVALGAKYLFTRESDPAKVRIAAGIGYDRALWKDTYAYVVGTKSFSGISADKAPITGHLGLRYDRFKVANVKSTKASVYAGAEIPVTADGAFSIVGEIQSKNNDFGLEKFPYSASIRYRPTGKPFGVSVGIQRQGLTGDNGVFAQIGYTFGGSTAPDAQ